MEKRWEYVGLLRRGLETEMGDSEEVFEVSERERESVCVWETNEMAKNERALKMKRDKKIEEKFRIRWGKFKGLLRRASVVCRKRLELLWRANETLQ